MWWRTWWIFNTLLYCWALLHWVGTSIIQNCVWNSDVVLCPLTMMISPSIRTKGSSILRVIARNPSRFMSTRDLGIDPSKYRLTLQDPIVSAVTLGMLLRSPFQFGWCTHHYLFGFYSYTNSMLWANTDRMH
jgi:hypothetical protein